MGVRHCRDTLRRPNLRHELALRELAPIEVRIAAPRVFVFQSVTAFDEPSPLWEPGLEPEVLDRQGRVLRVRFRTRTMGRVVATIQRVRLFPPERVLFERIEGGLGDMRGELVMRPLDGATILCLRSDVNVGKAVVGGLLERGLAGPSLRRVLVRMLTRWRVTIEAAARASGQIDEDLPTEN
jgi:hypothetical protein